MVSLSSRISPFASTVICFDRSPFATAVVTSAMLRTCDVRFPASWFTLSVESFHVPATPGTLACPLSLPSVPTSRATRMISDPTASCRLTTSLSSVAMAPIVPSPVPIGTRALKLPAFTAFRTASTASSCRSRAARSTSGRARFLVGRRGAPSDGDVPLAEWPLWCG